LTIVDRAVEASCFNVIRAVDLRGSSGESETQELSKDMQKAHRPVDLKLMEENVSGCWADRDESLDKNTNATIAIQLKRSTARDGTWRPSPLDQPES
jgi:hypothetical protein